MKKLKVLDLFSGIGGFSLGFHNTGGFVTSAFCEIDKPCQKVLKKNFPEVPIFDDIKKLKAKHLPQNIDVICGGFPCQDVSVAGLKKGFKNEKGEETRSGLWSEYKRLIKEIKPRWVVIENVPNLLNLGFAQVLKDLHEIGYDAEWETISARSVGSCHLRKRLWIIAYPNGQSKRGLPSGKKKEITSVNYTSINASDTSGESFRDGCEELCNQRRRVCKGGRKGIFKENRETQNLEFRASRYISANSHHFRFWPSFAAEEEKQKWWAKTTTCFRDWWQIESGVCRMDDGLPSGLESVRKQRVKMLGNSIVPMIAQIIGERILTHEKRRG